MLRRPTISTRTDTLFPYTTLVRSRLQPRAFSRTIAASMPREGTARIASPRLSRELAGWRRKPAAEAAPARSNMSFTILEQAALAVAFASPAEAAQAHAHQPVANPRRQVAAGATRRREGGGG